jgi:hypothetical protein
MCFLIKTYNFVCIYLIFISATITHIYMMSLSTKMWLKLFETLLQVVSSQDQRNSFIFTLINITVHPN